MLQIEAIKVVINTEKGVFGRTLAISKGLNIVRANNTSGKSSLFGAIIYGLGFEELLGSRNEKALQSVFKSVVKEFVNGDRNPVNEFVVTQSEIYLQINNGVKSITTKRYVVNDKIKAQAVEVFLGKQITEAEGQFERVPMYLHDKGGASNENVGFHKFLEEFIGINLPEILNQEGKRAKLYLPLISSVHFIEQKSGWSDFYANIPYYGIRDANSKVFEFILNLDVFGIATRRQEIQNRLREIEERWKISLDRVKSITSRGGGEIVGIPEQPEILTKDIRPFARFHRAEKTFLLNELISNIQVELKEIYSELNAPINSNIDKIEESLNNIKEQTEQYEILYESLGSEISQEKERLRQYNTQLKNVLEDLKKNKDAEKLQRLGLDANLKIGTGICPACSQTVNDSLLPEHLHILPMRIDENISYLNAQQKMIEAFINNLKETILNKETKLSSIENAIQFNRQKIRALKKDLTSDDRLPSEEVIERKVVSERELSFLYKLREEIEQSINSIYLVSEEYSRAKSDEAKLTKTYHSASDLEKIQLFETNFKSLLQKFGYTSKPISTIKISTEKYTPVYEVVHENGINRQVDIRFESSASDFIRAQWAYYTSLMKTSISKSGNHFLTLVFDEPQQQSASTVSFKSFLSELKGFKDEQIIVLGSFQNSDEDFNEATNGLTEVNIIDFAKNNNLVVERIG